MAILAVAFVVLAAVPAALTDSDVAGDPAVAGTVQFVKLEPADGVTYYKGSIADGNEVSGLIALASGETIIFVDVADDYDGTSAQLKVNGSNVGSGFVADGYKFTYAANGNVGVVTVDGVAKVEYDKETYSGNTASGTIAAGKMMTFTKNVSVASGETLTVTGKIVIPDRVTMTVVGTLDGAGTIVVQKGGSIVVGGTAAAGERVLTSTGKVIVEEGGSLEISSTSTSSMTKAEIRGSLSVKGTLGMTGAVSISSNVAVEGKLTTTNAAEILADGSVTVKETGTLEGKIVVKTGAELTMSGAAGATKLEVYNYGTVTINSEVAPGGANDTTIHMLANGAVADVKKYTDTQATNAKLYIDDAGAVLPKVTGGKDSWTVNTETNQIAITITPNTDCTGTVSGLYVVQDHQIVGTGSDAKYYSVLDMSGTVGVSAAKVAISDNAKYAKAVVALTENASALGGIAVTGELSIGTAVELTNTTGLLTVSGVLDVTAPAVADDSENQPAAKFTNNVSTSKVVVTGQLNVIATAMTNDVEAVQYSTVEDGVTYYHYVDINDALELVNQAGNTIKKLTVMGEQTVTGENAVLPAGVELAAGTKTIIIGEGAELTVKGTAKITGSGNTITVKGTLDADVEDNVKGTVAADVIIDSDTTVKTSEIQWTNIIDALKNAESGDEIAIAQAVTITEDATVKEGVKLIAETAAITVNKNVTLTIDGFVYSKSAITGGTGSNFAAEADKDNAAIAMGEGVLALGISVSGQTYAIDGAYYKIVYGGKAIDAISARFY